MVPRSLSVEYMMDEEFDQHQLGLAARSYNAYGALQQMVSSPEPTAEHRAALQQEETRRLNEKIGGLTSVIKAMQE